MAEPPPVQTKRTIEQLLRQAGLRPRKRLGQHFLIDGNLMRRLVACAELAPDEAVLEVGPGTGGLTEQLLPLVAQLAAVEADRDLVALLTSRLGEAANFTLFAGDVLETKHALHPELRDWLASASGRPLKLVANLPYQIATPLVMNLLLDYPQVTRFCFTVQREVGERVLAGPGSKAYGPLSIVAQALSAVQLVARVPGSAFWPVPQVESVMLRLDRGPTPFPSEAALRHFVRVVRETFEHRRKTLRAALKYVLPETAAAGLADEFDLTRRPETFALTEWQRIAELTAP